MSKVTAAKTKGRLTKQELKQDRLVKLAYQAEHFYLLHQKWVIGSVVAVLVIVLGVVLVRKTIQSSKLEDSYKVTMAKMDYGSGKLDDAKAGFERVLSSGGSFASAEARYFIGRIAFDKGNYQEAADNFNNYLKNSAGTDELDCAVLSGLAATYEALDKPEDAAKSYMKVAQEYPTNQFAPQALWEASRIYIKLNQNDNALSALQTIREKYSTSSIMGQAKRVLELLE